MFYSLGMYYCLCADDNAKALKCLDRALLLRPDFEQAFLLKYTLLCQDGQLGKGMEAISLIQKANRNLPSTYYLRGIQILNSGGKVLTENDYFEAIDNLQNADKFYSIQRQNKNEAHSLRPPHPLIQETKVAQEKMPLFRAYFGLFGKHQKQFVQVQVHLIECFSKIDQPQVSYKWFVRAMEEINFLLTTCNDAEEQAMGEEQEQEVSDFVANVSTGLDEFFNKSRHC